MGIFIGCLVAFISLVGSLMIIIAVATSKQNRANTQQRILAIMSTSDFLFAAAFILTFAIPHHGRKSQDVVCEIKGFVFMLFGTITNLYNASLATYYLLTIRYNYGNRKIKNRKLASYSAYSYWTSLYRNRCFSQRHQSYEAR